MNKEIKYLLEEIKDNTQDYVGTNGCLYQDLLREELNLLLDYINNLEKQVKKQKEVIDKVIELLNHPWSFESGNKQVDEITKNKKWEIINLLKEVE